MGSIATDYPLSHEAESLEDRWLPLTDPLFFKPVDAIATGQKEKDSVRRRRASLQANSTWPRT
jgi:hypothetical protein